MLWLLVVWLRFGLCCVGILFGGGYLLVVCFLLGSLVGCILLCGFFLVVSGELIFQDGELLHRFLLQLVVSY